MFSYNLINNKIDCPFFLLQKLNFKINSRNSRQKDMYTIKKVLLQNITRYHLQLIY